MLVNIACNDWVNPNDVSAIEQFADNTVAVYLRNGSKLSYPASANPNAAVMSKRVNDACAKLYDLGNA